MQTWGDKGFHPNCTEKMPEEFKLFVHNYWETILYLEILLGILKSMLTQCCNLVMSMILRRL